MLGAIRSRPLIGGVRLRALPGVVVIDAATPLRALGSAPLGGGLRESRCIFNRQVSLDYDCERPDADLAAAARALGLPAGAIGLLTAADVARGAVCMRRRSAWTVAALATAGLGNASYAGQPLPRPHAGGERRGRPGTINVIVLIAGRLDDGALVNAVVTATEAKARALRDRDVRCPDGTPATGTSTDAVVVACTGAGPSARYAGPATVAGHLIGGTVHAAVLAAVDREQGNRGIR